MGRTPMSNSRNGWHERPVTRPPVQDCAQSAEAATAVAEVFQGAAMTRMHAQIVDSWSDTIRRAIELGDAGSAYRLTVALVQRIHELSVGQMRITVVQHAVRRGAR